MASELRLEETRHASRSPNENLRTGRISRLIKQVPFRISNFSSSRLTFYSFLEKVPPWQFSSEKGLTVFGET